MLRIYLARHGQDLDNANGILNGRRDEPLTELGLAQAHESAERIAALGIKFDQVYSSPLQRAYVAAAIIAERLGLPAPEKLADLIERDFGVGTGTPVSEIEARFAPDIIKSDIVTYFLAPEGAETFPQMIERGQRLLAWLKSQHADGNILLVSHGDIGKMIYAAYYGLDWREVLKTFRFGNSELLLLAPDSPAEEAHVFRIKQYNV